MNNSLNKKVIQISSNKNNLSEEELNKIIDNARQMDEIDRIDKYKKESYLQLKENCKCSQVNKRFDVNLTKTN